MDEIDHDKEFKEALRYIAFAATKFNKSHDRVNLAEWIRRLVSHKANDLNACKLRNEYAQYLRTMMPMGYLTGPFKNPPNAGPLLPLPELLCNFMADQIKELPRTGPIYPVVTQTTPDGCGTLCLKCTDQGLLCFMSVQPGKGDQET